MIFFDEAGEVDESPYSYLLVGAAKTFNRHRTMTPPTLRSIGTHALRLFLASFLVVPVVVTALLLPSHTQYSDRDMPRSNPLATNIIRKGRVNDQRRSPLFSVLPPEIRNRIFEFACKAYETVGYTPNDWFYRPGYHAHRRISASLLATCKRIYLETFTLPLSLNEHVFWGSIDRAPPKRYSGVDSNKRTDLNAFFDCLTPYQRSSVQEVHLFAQQFWLEDLDLTSDRIVTRKIKLTLRHQDWYFWEEDESLGICPWIGGRVEADEMIRETETVPSLPQDLDRYLGWGRQFEFVHGLEELEIEFETLKSLKELEMDPIVKFAKRWQFPLMRKGVLEWDEASGIREYTWTGSKLLKGEFDESMFDFYEHERDNLNEADHESGSDVLAYETASAYDYSDWEDNSPSFAEQQDVLAEDMEHAHPTAASELENDDSDTEHSSNNYDATREQNDTVDSEDLAGDQETTGPVTHEAPQIIDAVDAYETASQSPDNAETLEDDGHDERPTLQLLALESNMQDYYVVSMIWRKKK